MLHVCCVYLRDFNTERVFFFNGIFQIKHQKKIRRVKKNELNINFLQ